MNWSTKPVLLQNCLHCISVFNVSVKLPNYIIVYNCCVLIAIEIRTVLHWELSQLKTILEYAFYKYEWKFLSTINKFSYILNCILFVLILNIISHYKPFLHNLFTVLNVCLVLNSIRFYIRFTQAITCV